MAQDVGGDGLDVLRGDVAAALQEGVGLRRQHQREGRAGGGAVADVAGQGVDLVGRRIARGEDEGEDVVLDLVVHVDVVHRAARLQDRLRRHHRLHAVHHFRAGVGVQDAALFVERGIADLELEHEAVHLGLGQRVRAFLLDRVLRGEDEEGFGEGERFLADRHLALLHRFEEGRLDLGGRAVDFVGEHDVREDGALAGAEVAGLGVVDLRADEVRGQQVRRELDAAEGRLERGGQRLDRERLGETRHALQQDVAVGEQADQKAVEHVALADDDFFEFRAEGRHERALLLHFFVDGGDAARAHGVSLVVPGAGLATRIRMRLFSFRISGGVLSATGPGRRIRTEPDWRLRASAESLLRS